MENGPGPFWISFGLLVDFFENILYVSSEDYVVF